MKPVVYFEVSPLFERNFSGIPNVAKELARRFLADTATLDTRFFINWLEIPQSFVRLAIDDASGARLADMARLPLKRIAPAAGSIGFFPNYKSIRGVFSTEGFIVHDLSTVTTPQFHSKETIRHHRTTVARDIETSDVIFAVSHATLRDLELYFPQSMKKRRVICNPGAVVADFSMPSFHDPRPIITVLGTLEPRKNIRQVLEYIAESPTFASRFAFILPGKFGWGESMHRLIERLGLEPQVASGTIQFPGYISEEAKLDLIRRSHLLIYPSVFEGYGMPVREAFVCGAPVLTTRSSSIPEVAPSHVHYFSPFKRGDFGRQFEALAAQFGPSADSVRGQAIQEQHWDQSYETVKAALLQ